MLGTPGAYDPAGQPGQADEEGVDEEAARMVDQLLEWGPLDPLSAATVSRAGQGRVGQGGTRGGGGAGHGWMEQGRVERVQAGHGRARRGSFGPGVRGHGHGEMTGWVGGCECVMRGVVRCVSV